MRITVDKSSKTPIYLQISTQIKELILSGNLATGSILPSERTLAEILDIHRNTVTKAYHELKAQGFIAPKQGVAHAVSYEIEGKSQGTGQKDKKVNWSSIIKEEYQDMSVTFDDLFERYAEDGIISLGGGISSPSIYDKKDIAKELSEIIAEVGKTQYFYSPYQGDETLIKRLSSFVSTKGIKASKSEIQIMSETNQALDFIVHLLVRPGDVVMMEEPVSPDAYRAMELAGASVITIPVDEEGMMCHNLEGEVEKYKPRLIYVNSSYHDPTGAILSLERREKLMELSNKYRFPIIEEDAASELNYSDNKLPTIKSLDRSDNVIYIYSFSLTFAPGLSLAFVVAPKKLIKSLSYLVAVRLVAIDWVTQKLLAKYMSQGVYYSKLNEYRENYREKKEIMCRSLDALKELGVSYKDPEGGVYIWVKLPPGIDSEDFMDNCFKNGVTLLPGYVFFPKKNGGRDHVRLNYSYEDAEKIRQGMKIFEKTLKRMLAHEK